MPSHRLVLQGFRLRLPGLDPQPETSYPRLELRALDQPLGIAVYDATHAAAQLGKLHLDGCKIEPARVTVPRHLEPALILQSDPRGVT